MELYANDCSLSQKLGWEWVQWARLGRLRPGLWAPSGPLPHWASGLLGFWSRDGPETARLKACEEMPSVHGICQPISLPHLSSEEPPRSPCTTRAAL